MDRISCRMVSTPCPSRGSSGEPCSRSSAGILFCPRYLEVSAVSDSFQGDGVSEMQVPGSHWAEEGTIYGMLQHGGKEGDG
jgi:hypothetical protein